MSRAFGWWSTLALAAIVACSGGTEPPVDPGPTPTLDQTKPVVGGFIYARSGAIDTAPAAAAFRSGDTLNFRVTARDEHKVAWMGFAVTEFPQLRDSVEVPDSIAALPLRIEASLALTGGYTGPLTLTGFARDSSGNLTEQRLGGSPASVFTTHPVTAIESLHLPVQPGDVAWDAKRGVLYVGQPDSSRIAIVSLAPFAVQGAIDLPAQPGGFDLTVSGDSLLVALPSMDAYGVVDLAAAPRAVTTVAETLTPTATHHRPQSLRVAVNGHAIVLRRSDLLGADGHLVDFDLATGEQRIRFDIATGGNGHVDNALALARPADRSRVVFADQSSSPTGGTQAYFSASGVFSAPASVPELYGMAVSASADGARILVGTSVLDGTMSPLAIMHPPGTNGKSATIAPDGELAYFIDYHGLDTGLLRVRATSGLVLDEVTLATNSGDIDWLAPALRFLPGEARLLLATWSGLKLVTLPPLPQDGPALLAARSGEAATAARPARPWLVSALRVGLAPRR